MKRITMLLAAGILFLCSMFTFIPSEAEGAVPQLINFQGILRDGSGNPVANGSYSVQFTIYDAVTGGTNLWQETQSVNTVNGLFTVLLGSGVIPLDYSLFNDSTRWLGVKVGADPEMTPRQRLSSVGYSHNSSEWTSAAGNLFRLNGNVGVGTGSPTAKLHVENSAGTGVYSSSSTGIGVWGEGITWGLYGNSTSGTGVVASSSSGYGVSAAGGAYGVFGTSSSGTGVYGLGNTYGVYGRSGGTAAVYGDINGNFGTYGGYFQGDVRVERNLVVSGAAYMGGTNGVYASASGGPGVVASGSTNGVEATGTTRGVYATGTGYGIVAAGRYGAYGYSNYGSSVLDAGYAVFGESGNPNAWAGYFSGHCKITGTLTVDGLIYKNGGGFRIDHPTDPANKYLYHSFVESPDMTNFYNGNVTLDANGEAAVQLPDWFGALNKDFRYQLTAIGAPGPNLYIAQKVSNNQFRIGGGTPGTEVSWQVTGIRQDAYANAHRIPVEEVKTGRERGKYLHPEEEGVSETLGMDYEMTQKMAVEHQKMEAERKQMEEQRAKMERLIPEQKIKENK